MDLYLFLHGKQIFWFYGTDILIVLTIKMSVPYSSYIEILVSLAHFYSLWQNGQYTVIFIHYTAIIFTQWETFIYDMCLYIIFFCIVVSIRDITLVSFFFLSSASINKSKECLYLEYIKWMILLRHTYLKILLKMNTKTDLGIFKRWIKSSNLLNLLLWLYYSEAYLKPNPE